VCMCVCACVRACVCEGVCVGNETAAIDLLRERERESVCVCLRDGVFRV